MTYHMIVTTVTQRVRLVEQELLSLPEHLFTQCLVWFVFLNLYFNRQLFVSLPYFSLGHCIICLL